MGHRCFGGSCRQLDRPLAKNLNVKSKKDQLHSQGACMPRLSCKSHSARAQIHSGCWSIISLTKQMQGSTVHIGTTWGISSGHTCISHGEQENPKWWVQRIWWINIAGRTKIAARNTSSNVNYSDKERDWPRVSSEAPWCKRERASTADDEPPNSEQRTTIATHIASS